MGIEEVSNLNITCDNPDCPGTKLDPTERKGWLFVTAEVYGEPSVQQVFCSYECASAHAIIQGAEVSKARVAADAA